MNAQSISAEFRGLARDFRRKIEAADACYMKSINQIRKPLELRLARKPTLRDGTAIDVERAFKALPHPFRIGLQVMIKPRGHLVIIDWVLDAMQGRQDHWGDEEWEKTVGILAVTITTLGGVAIRSDPLVSLSGHAIARWFERTRSRDQARLLRDIGMILDSTEPDHAVASKGLWLGSTVNAHQGERRLTLRTIRTYLDADEIDTRSLPGLRETSRKHPTSQAAAQ